MKRLSIAAVGLALVVGVIVGGMAGNPFGAAASPDPPNPGHSWNQIELPPSTWVDLDADMVDGYHASELGDGGCCLAETGTPLNLTELSSCDGHDTGTLYTVPPGRRALIHAISITVPATTNQGIVVETADDRRLTLQQTDVGTYILDIVVEPGVHVDWWCNGSGSDIFTVALTGIEFSPP